jgi:3-phosphoshikimate 1-carboxyvinyltransferase
MITFIKPSRIDGRTDAPPSKSAMLRAAAAAALAPGRSRIAHPSFCDDARAALGIVETLGAEVRVQNGAVEIEGGGAPRPGDLHCGESGFCLRMFLPITAVIPSERLLRARGSLSTRSVGPVEEPLRRLGCDCRTFFGYPPVSIRGPLRGGECIVDASLSSQFLSGLLFALPLAEKPSTVHVSALNSRPYIDMTRRVLKDFGIEIGGDGCREFRIDAPQKYRPAEYHVEGDWSGAAFLLVAGAIAGRVCVSGLDFYSAQADRRILDLLEACGARTAVVDGCLVVEEGNLTAFHFDAVDCPDLFPPLAALACFCRGTSRIRGVHRLRAKESDRAAALAGELSAAGAEIGLEEDTMVIRGRSIQGGSADARGDHRIAMALAVAGLGSREGLAVAGSECVSKSYPEFFRDLSRLGAEIHE